MCEQVSACEHLEALGLALESRRATLRPGRLWMLRQAARALLTRGVCSGRGCVVIFGHFTFCFLLSRLLLSIFRSTSFYSRKCFNRYVHLWSSVRRELTDAVHLFTLIESDYDGPWNQSVYVSDSSLTGFAAHKTEWPIEAVRATGSVSERWRCW